MRGKEKKAWEEMVANASKPEEDQWFSDDTENAILAADAELKRLRKDLWLLMNYFQINDEFLVNQRRRAEGKAAEE